MNNLTFTGYLMQIFAAELIFLYSAEKRSRFFLRLAAAFAVICLSGMVFPMAGFDNSVYQLFVYLLFFAVNVVLMSFCFAPDCFAVTASCVAGYAAQHISFHVCVLLGCTGLLRGAGLFGLEDIHLIELIFFPVLYFLFWVTFGRFYARNECYKKYDVRFLSISFVTVFICIGLSRFVEAFGARGTVIVSLYAITACLMALMVQLVLYRLVSLRAENETLSLLWQEERKQYELSKKTIDTINIKYHDLKKRLKGMNIAREEAETIQDALRIYQSQFKTGSDALDVLLTENSLRCSEEGISITFMGNGEDFSFMNTTDVYSLFGNAIDNAVEAVRRVEDPEKRFIDITTERRGDMVNVSVVNYFEGRLKLEDGVPATSKTEEEGYHGFGIKSMQRIAEKYGGRLGIQVEDGGLFRLNAYLLSGKAE